jgi:putative oxidoreductase
MDFLALIGRIAMSAIFIWAGYGKLMAPDAIKPMLGGMGLPLSADIIYWAVVVIELGGGALLLLGILPRLVALGLAAWCVITAVMVHYHPDQIEQMINFYKNIAIAGGLLQIVGLGAGRLSLTR